MSTLSDAESIAMTLNDYVFSGQKNIWRDVIFPLPEYDDDLTHDADPGYANRTVVLRDCSIIIYDPRIGEWYVSRYRWNPAHRMLAFDRR